MAGAPDAAGRLAWPRRYRHSPSSPEVNLDRYIPAQWRSKAAWHGYRAHVAKSLNRPALPEVIAMGVQDNMRPTRYNNPDAVDELWSEPTH
jgi:hypothetical protein